tara:strand:+ start:475 stop:666 length:192 start_codon:yes stop_codon:yes gene_type:complete
LFCRLLGIAPTISIIASTDSLSGVEAFKTSFADERWHGNVVGLAALFYGCNNVVGVVLQGVVG